MAENIIMGCGLVLYAAAFLFIMRYNVHMFQQNSYKNKVQLVWLTQNRERQRVLLTAFLAAVLAGGLFHAVTAVLAALAAALCFWYYLMLARQKAKKKLVYTSRVKRLIATNLLLAVVFAVLCIVCKSRMLAYFIAGLFVFCEPYFVVLSNVINAPVERAVRNYYIRDAKRMLREHKNLTVIGVTGSYGKTSVKFYLNALLQTKFQVLATPESYNTPMGVVKTIRSSLNPTHEIFLCEVGAKNSGDIKELCDIVHPKHGIITAIGPQHLESFHSIDNIIRTKFELADALPADGLLFLNGDNDYIRKENRAGIFYSTAQQKEEREGSALRNADVTAGKPAAGYRASDLKVSALGTTFTVTAPNGETAEFRTKLVGAHNVVNIVGAIAVANTLGISLEELKLPVRRLQPVEHRLQLIERGNVTIIDDAYNSNPIGSKAAVDTLALFDGLRILVTPGMIELGEKEEEYNYEFGRAAAAACDYIALVGKRRTEPIAKGVLDAGFPAERLFVADKLEEAVNYAYALNTEKHKFILLENDLPDNY
ncbi:MAG: Mur ligase family protein, partial [Lachnospiraceae bacterium]